ncbi:phage antirepressor Ant [Isoptericola halotolerans]|uniref:Anti-repressor protein n=1 Tax=Isoptericola halotolerans TaxID=300560 RepID=A0ABX2A6F5_9MICO|nr:phage antirepressor KilAC domain-containing protein [Isoptericola halotolerans]NOV98171.1 anti-repressor protein [Isoptericola halotolerans]
MTQLQPFDFDGTAVRVITDEHGEPWFVLTDLCKILGLTRRAAAVAERLADDEKGVRLADTPGGPQNLTMVTEAGMWTVILRSDSPAAEPVRRWVTHEVLPTIRRTGQYGAAPALTEDQIVAQALQITTAKVRQLEAKVEQDAPKVIFADAVATSRTDILVGDLAKILKGNGVEVGGTRLFEWLRRDGYLIKRRGTDRNMPTQRSMELGLFRVKETAVTHSDGHVTISKTPKVTGKGQTYFINRYVGAEVAA